MTIILVQKVSIEQAYHWLDISLKGPTKELQKVDSNSKSSVRNVDILPEDNAEYIVGVNTDKSKLFRQSTLGSKSFYHLLIFL